jgi:hypothetical protein
MVGHSIELHRVRGQGEPPAHDRRGDITKEKVAKRKKID